MIFVVLTDRGILTQPLEATNLADAATQIKEMYGQGTDQVRVALLLPTVTGRLLQNPDPALATLQMTGDSQTQQQIRQNLATFLGLASPTNAQILAAVRALTRLASADFTGST